MESLASVPQAEVRGDAAEQDIGERMIKLRLDVSASRGLQILCLGAHSDDIEIGCGGTDFVGWRKGIGECTFHWVVFSANRTSAATEAQSAAGRASLVPGRLHWASC